MDLKKLAEPFLEEEIEWRIGQSGKTQSGKIWAKCLAYVQARAIMDRLDQVVGAENWTIDYKFIGAMDKIEAGVIARLGIKTELGWVYKEDGAEQTDFEPFKGGLSSALKRAAVPWGIGRYLYGLKADFALICDKETEGAQYAKTKEGAVFYWIPPKLPSWALPESQKKKISTQATIQVRSPEPLPLTNERDQLNKKAMELYQPFLKKYPKVELSKVMKERYGISETRLLTLEQFTDFVSYMGKGLQAP